jgi:formate hydrogenlyase regulatory protein HycA
VGGVEVAAPEKLRIPQDEYRFEYIGRVDGDGQFMAFVTGAMPHAFWKGQLPADPEMQSMGDYYAKHKGWYAVVHRFDADGNHLRTEARLGGKDGEGKGVACDRAWELLNEMAKRMGPVVFGNISVKPFSVEVDGVLFGLIYESKRDEEDGSLHEQVMLQPNDVMFHPPWDSGEYST